MNLTKECPRHEGNFDCTSFCPLCEGEQEVKYFNIPVNIVVYAEDLEEAQLKANLFMPWTTTGSDWSLTGHKYLTGYHIDQWNVDGVDSDEMEGKLIELGYR